MKRLTLEQRRSYYERGARIVWAMDKVGITQVEMARKLGIHQSYLSAVCRGEKSGESHLSKISRVCGVSVKFLETGIPPSQESFKRRPKRARAVRMNSKLLKRMRQPLLTLEIGPAAKVKIMTELIDAKATPYSTQKVTAFLILLPV